jgi:hypothetical protein
MALWCRDFPTVSVPQGIGNKSFTVVLPYFENPQFLRQQIGWWGTYSETLRHYVVAIVVDDGSPSAPAEPIVRANPARIPLSLYRIGADVRWNWLAARNIGAHHAKVMDHDGNVWLLLTDMDHVLPASTAESLMYGKHDPNVVYAFSRIEHTGEPASPHSASFFMTKQMFWKIGGYDETLSGFYGTDGDYRRRLAQHAKIQILEDRLIRHEHQGDSSTTKYLRKQPEDAAVKSIIAKRGKGWKPKVLSFPYEQVFP